MRYINLTPHDVTLYAEDGATVLERIPPSGAVARVVMTDPEPDKYAAGAAVPLFTPGRVHSVNMGVTDELNDRDAVYIVSMFTAQALVDCSDRDGPWRGRVVYPGTGPTDNAVRDEQGRICGVTRLYRPFPGWWSWPTRPSIEATA